MDRQDDRRRDDDLQLNDPAHTADRSIDELRSELGANTIPEDGGPTTEGERVAEDAQRVDVDTKDKVAGGAIGGASGAAVGAGIGTLIAGPIGTAVGAIAGAVGGWWAGHASTVAAEIKDDDETYYRTHYESGADRPAGRTYNDLRPAYHLGHVARHNPDYRGRPFEEVEADLQKGWTEDLRTRHGDWSVVRPHVQAAYSRNPDLSPETVSERTVLRASERARDRLAGGRDGLRSDDTAGF